MRKRKGFAHEDNEKDHWLTPPPLIVACGPFDLDPCAYHSQPWRTAAKQYALPHEDGLLLPWAGCVWCNPPYGNETEKWIGRMSLHSNGVMLIYARTETLGFRGIWKYADAILFFYKRIAFHLPNGQSSEGSTAPSVLAAFGKQNISRLRAAIGGGVRGCVGDRMGTVSPC